MLCGAVCVAWNNFLVLYVYGGSSEPVWRWIRFEQLGAVVVNIKTCLAKKQTIVVFFAEMLGRVAVLWTAENTYYTEIVRDGWFQGDTIGGRQQYGYRD